MNKIRDDFSDIMGIRIQNDNWIGYIGILEREAHFNNVHRNQLLVALGKAVEELQSDRKNLIDQITVLSAKVQLLEKKSETIALQKETDVDQQAKPTKPDAKKPVQPAQK